MRAAPALALTIERYGCWRVTVALLCAAAAAAVGAWLGAGRWAVAIGIVAAAGSLVTTRRTAVRLSWDGEQWALGLGPAPSGHVAVGRPRVMIDIGPFMLLRFERASAPVLWLPLQRYGYEASWHALRCAVYSPRPPAASVPADASPPA
jgi:hypothetical protein